MFCTLGYHAHQHASMYLYFSSQHTIPLSLISPFSITSFFSLLQQQTSSCLGEVKVTQSFLTLCDPWTIQSMEFSRPEYWGGYPFPSPEDLPNPGIKPRSPALQADSLPAKPQGKPCLTLLQCLTSYPVMILSLVFY